MVSAAALGARRWGRGRDWAAGGALWLLDGALWLQAALRISLVPCCVLASCCRLSGLAATRSSCGDGGATLGCSGSTAPCHDYECAQRRQGPPVCLSWRGYTRHYTLP